MTYQEIYAELLNLAQPKVAKIQQGFFKTGPGEYGFGDLFLGIKTPPIRSLAKAGIGLKRGELKKLIKSRYHEARLLGLLILCLQYHKTKCESEREEIYQFYCSHFKYINNWDLVDVTCPHIVGRHLINRDRRILKQWASSPDLWTKRIAMISNWWFIRHGDLKSVFTISKILLKDDHDLIHKAVGWMLREAAKKDQEKVEQFIIKNYQQMPRTMLRYAIERFDPKKRQSFLKGKFN